MLVQQSCRAVLIKCMNTVEQIALMLLNIERMQKFLSNFCIRFSLLVLL